jgi:hypothetical protein
VKKRIRMCGRPAVPNISAMPKLIAEIGSLMKLPGAISAWPILAGLIASALEAAAAAAATASGVVAAAALAAAAATAAALVLTAMAIFTATPLANSASGLKPNCASTMMAMKVTPDSSRHALMICTQVVAVMPPNST